MTTFVTYGIHIKDTIYGHGTEWFDTYEEAKNSFDTRLSRLKNPESEEKAQLVKITTVVTNEVLEERKAAQ